MTGGVLVVGVGLSDGAPDAVGDTVGSGLSVGEGEGEASISLPKIPVSLPAEKSVEKFFRGRF